MPVGTLFDIVVNDMAVEPGQRELYMYSDEFMLRASSKITGFLNINLIQMWTDL